MEDTWIILISTRNLQSKVGECHHFFLRLKKFRENSIQGSLQQVLLLISSIQVKSVTCSSFFIFSRCTQRSNFMKIDLLKLCRHQFHNFHQFLPFELFNATQCKVCWWHPDKALACISLSCMQQMWLRAFFILIDKVFFFQGYKVETSRMYYVSLLFSLQTRRVLDCFAIKSSVSHHEGVSMIEFSFVFPFKTGRYS